MHSAPLKPKLRPEALPLSDPRRSADVPPRCRVAVIWIDWYAYHVARFGGLLGTPELEGAVAGIEMVGGIGVHAGLKFREPLPEGLPVQTLMPDRSWSEAGQFGLARAVWRALDRLDPEVVLVPGYYTLPAIAAAVWARVHGRTGVLMTESTAADHQRSPWKERLKGWLIRGLFRWAVAGGAAHVRYLKQLGFPPDRIARFYDVVDNERFGTEAAELRRSLTPAEAGLAKLLPGTPYFLYVGRLAPEKNVEALVRAWIGYRRAGGAWPLVLVGDGPSAAALKAEVAASGFAAEVEFAGLRGSRELPPFYAFAGCFVLPSTREPWGLVVNEAMASGLPVIVSDRCGCAEDLVMHGKNGLTFNPESESELGHCLHLMATFRPEKLAQMRLESMERIADYSPANFGLEIARIVRSERLARSGRPASGRGGGSGRRRQAPGRPGMSGAKGRQP